MSSTPSSEPLMSCSACGATVYPEHIERHMAGYWTGALYCSYCLAEKKKTAASPGIPAELTTFPLEDSEAAPASATGNVPPAGAPASAPAAPAAVGAAHAHRHPPRPDARGATRLRIFHCRLSDGAVNHLDQQINDWLYQNPEVEIKFATSTVGVWEGKHAEPNLIVTLFY